MTQPINLPPMPELSSGIAIWSEYGKEKQQIIAVHYKEEAVIEYAHAYATAAVLAERERIAASMQSLALELTALDNRMQKQPLHFNQEVVFLRKYAAAIRAPVVDKDEAWGQSRVRHPDYLKEQNARNAEMRGNLQASQSAGEKLAAIRARNDALVDKINKGQTFGSSLVSQPAYQQEQREKNEKLRDELDAALDRVAPARRPKPE